MNKFILNNRFVVDPSLNLVNDKGKQTENHLEPRLMKLLCLLSSHAGRLVSRDYIYQEIWNNYGGADEGLTQAISFLRKVLNDKDKKIIETIPKKGYILHAIYTNHGNFNIDQVQKGNYHPWLVPATFCVAIVFIIISLEPILAGHKNTSLVGRSESTVIIKDSIKLLKSGTSIRAKERDFSIVHVDGKKKTVGNGTKKQTSEKNGLATVSPEKRRMVAESMKVDTKEKTETSKRNFTDGIPQSKMEKEKSVNHKQNPDNGIEKRQEEKSGLGTVSSEKRRMIESQGTSQKKNSETP